MQQLSLKNGKILNFGSKIKEIRERLNLYQDDIARITDVSKSLISRIELGSIKAIQATMIIRIVEELNINVNWLMFDEGEMMEEKVNTKSVILENERLKQELIDKDKEMERIKNHVDILIRTLGFSKDVVR